MLWILLTVAAAFLQNVRSALQKSLKGKLGTTGATFVRFVYALPVAAVYVFGLVRFTPLELPEVNSAFFAYVVLGGLAQIAGTGLLVSLFDQRSFAVGATYSKTETVQAALFAILFLGETVSLAATLGIAISLAGVVAISTAHRPGPAPGSGSTGGAGSRWVAGRRCWAWVREAPSASPRSPIGGRRCRSEGRASSSRPPRLFCVCSSSRRWPWVSGWPGAHPPSCAPVPSRGDPPRSSVSAARWRRWAGSAR